MLLDQFNYRCNTFIGPLSLPTYPDREPKLCCAQGQTIRYECPSRYLTPSHRGLIYPRDTCKGSDYLHVPLWLSQETRPSKGGANCGKQSCHTYLLAGSDEFKISTLIY